MYIIYVRLWKGPCGIIIQFAHAFKVYNYPIRVQYAYLRERHCIHTLHIETSTFHIGINTRQTLN